MPNCATVPAYSIRDFYLTEIERCRRLAASDLWSFANYIAPPHYNLARHHELLYRWLGDLANGRRQRIILEVPPGHGKSEGLSRNLPAFAFGQNQDLRVVACSYTQDLAAEMNRDVQRLMDSDEYAQLFPNVHLGGQNIRTLAGQPRRNSDIFDIPG